MKAIYPQSAADSWLGQLVADVNRQLTRSDSGDIPVCLLASGQMGADFADVDLSPYRHFPNG